jgi:Protein of unknown function (DUF3421)
MAELPNPLLWQSTRRQNELRRVGCGVANRRGGQRSSERASRIMVRGQYGKAEFQYFCRAQFPDGSTHPGKLVPQVGCWVPYGGKAQLKPVYEVLVDLNPTLPLQWDQADGAVPTDRAIVGGIDALDNQNLYICATVYNGSYHIGKTKAGWPYCDIAWGTGQGSEHFVSYDATTIFLIADFFKKGSASLYPNSSAYSFPVGTDAGKDLFVCRAYLSTYPQPFNIQPGGLRGDWSLCHYGYGLPPYDKDIPSSDYNVLSE